MTFDIVFVLGLTLAALVLFALDRLRLDQVAMAVPVVLLLSGILTPAQAVSGLSSRATVTVGSMLVLGLGLRKTGLVSAIGAWARTAPLGGKYTRLLVLCLICAFLSPFLMTTAVVMVFIPVFIALADQAEEPASRYLMPLSFVSILGGTVTLMGTSTNLVVHGEAMSRGFDELRMFSITPLGLICLAVGLLYLFTAGRVLLPRRVRPPDLSSKYDVRRLSRSCTSRRIRPRTAARWPNSDGANATTSPCWTSNAMKRRSRPRTGTATFARATSCTCRGPPRTSSTSRADSGSRPRWKGKSTTWT